MIALDLDPYTAAHVAIALRRHRNTLLSTGRPCPEGLAIVEQMAAKVAKGGQAGTDEDSALVRLGHIADSGDGNGRAPLAPKEAAALLGVSTKTVQRQISSGSLPSVLVGKRRRVPRAAIEARLVGEDQ